MLVIKSTYLFISFFILFKYYKKKNLQFVARHGRVHYANCCIWHERKNVKILRVILKNPKHPTSWALKHVTSQQSCPNDSFLVRPAFQFSTATAENRNSSSNINSCRHQHTQQISGTTTAKWKKKLQKYFKNLLKKYCQLV